MATNPPSPASVPLEYAPAPPRWRKPARRFLLGLVLTMIAFCGWRWGPYAWHQTRLLYWQRQCMDFSLPADTVVYEEEPAAATLLLKRSDYSPYVFTRAASPNDHPTAAQAAAFYPKCLRMLANFATTPRLFLISNMGSGAI